MLARPPRRISFGQVIAVLTTLVTFSFNISHLPKIDSVFFDVIRASSSLKDASWLYLGFPKH